jgi:hypothetical protein
MTFQFLFILNATTVPIPWRDSISRTSVEGGDDTTGPRRQSNSIYFFQIQSYFSIQSSF